MLAYVLTAGVVFLANLLPAFAPPTWAILVFLTLRYDLEPVPTVLLGVLSATSGRYLLASGFRRWRSLLPPGWVTNMENASTHLQRSSGREFALVLLFFLSPFSSAQLFEAAGVMRAVSLERLAGAFAAGRLITYSTYVGGAHAIAATSLGEVFRESLTSPKAIAIQVAMVVLLVALGNIKWRPREEPGPSDPGSTL